VTPWWMASTLPNLFAGDDSATYSSTGKGRLGQLPNFCQTTEKVENSREFARTIVTKCTN